MPAIAVCAVQILFQSFHRDPLPHRYLRLLAPVGDSGTRGPRGPLAVSDTAVSVVAVDLALPGTGLQTATFSLNRCARSATAASGVVAIAAAVLPAAAASASKVRAFTGVGTQSQASSAALEAATLTWHSAPAAAVAATAETGDTASVVACSATAGSAAELAPLAASASASPPPAAGLAALLADMKDCFMARRARPLTDCWPTGAIGAAAEAAGAAAPAAAVDGAAAVTGSDPAAAHAALAAPNPPLAGTLDPMANFLRPPSSMRVTGERMRSLGDGKLQTTATGARQRQITLGSHNQAQLGCWTRRVAQHAPLMRGGRLGVDDEVRRLARRLPRDAAHCGGAA